MGNRIVLVLGVVAVAVLGATWYAAWAPSQSDRSTTPAEVAVSAVEAGSGTWVRYLVTVKNAGDSDFAGDVVLLNRAPAGDGPAPAPTPSPAGIPRVPTSLPRFPTTAPDAAYQVHFKLGAGQTRTVTIVAPDRYATVAVGQDPDGEIVADADVDRSGYVPVAALTTAQPVLDQLQGVRFDDLVLRVTDYAEARTVPTSALGYAPYAAVVVDGFDLGRLSEAQRVALRDYVGQGGSLVVAGGADWRQTLGQLPAELAALRPSATANAGAAPLLALAGRSGDPEVTIATGSVPAAARVATPTSDGRPLVVELAYGQGVAVALAFDPRVTPTGSAVTAAAWQQAIGRALPHPAGAAPGAGTVPGVSASTAFEFPPLRAAALPSPWLVGPLLLVYLLLVAPANYLFLRRRVRNPDLLWITAPLIAALFTGGFYWLGAALQGDLTDEQLQVLRLGPGSSVADLQYHRIVFLHRGDHVLQTVNPALAAPLTFDLSGASGSECGQSCGIELSGLRSGEEHVVPALQPVILEHGVVYGGVRILGTASTEHLPIGVDAHLQSVGGRVVGTVVNRGDRPVHGLVLYSLAGGSFHRTPLTSLVAPHTSVQVDAAQQPWDGDPNSPLPGTKATPDAGTRLSRAVGLEALSRSGSPWIVGFTDPLPGSLKVDGALPKQSAITVFEAPAVIDQADGQVSDFAVRRLAASTGDRSGGFSDVYDLELPGRLPSALSLSYDKFQYSQVEVYDWARGTWRKPAWADDPGNSSRFLAGLGATELAPAGDGSSQLLRVRVREVRLSWGANLYVTGARA